MTKEQELLLAYANKKFGVAGQDMTWDTVASVLATPDWSPSGPWQFKWEEFLPDDLPPIWNDLPLEARIMARIVAEETMDRYGYIPE